MFLSADQSIPTANAEDSGLPDEDAVGNLSTMGDARCLQMPASGPPAFSSTAEEKGCAQSEEDKRDLGDWFTDYLWQVRSNVPLDVPSNVSPRFHQMLDPPNVPPNVPSNVSSIVAFRTAMTSRTTR